MEILWKRTFFVEFWANRAELFGSCALPEKFYTMKFGKMLVFHVVNVIAKPELYWSFLIMFSQIYRLISSTKLQMHFSYIVECAFATAGSWFMKLELTKTTLRKKCSNTELFLVRIFQYSVRIQENAHQKNLRICTLFTQC